MYSGNNTTVKKKRHEKEPFLFLFREENYALDLGNITIVTSLI